MHKLISTIIASEFSISAVFILFLCCNTNALTSYNKEISKIYFSKIVPNILYLLEKTITARFGDRKMSNFTINCLQILKEI